MNVTTEQKENCVLDLHIELPPEYFEKEKQRIVTEYCRLARIPGFRKGKAPAAAIEKKYSKEIQEEAIDRLIQSSVRDAINDKNLTLAQHPEVRDIKLEENHTLRFMAIVTTSPEIELPEYRGLDVSVEKGLLDEARVEEQLEKLREDFADFENVEGRGLEMGDFAVLDYEGTFEGKPLTELQADLPPSFAGRHNSWFRLEEKSPLPGLSEALVGLQPNETRACEVTFPETFLAEALRGKKATYNVTLHEIKVRQLLPLDDDFAAKLNPELTLEKLRADIRARMQYGIDQNFQQMVRAAVAKELLSKVICEPPSTVVQRESAELLKNIIHDNQTRGVSDEEIKKHQAELMNSAKQNAEEKVRLNFILGAIAAKEEMSVTPAEMALHLSHLSERYKMPPEKLLKELKKHNALPGIREEVLLAKTFDLIVGHAKVNGLSSTHNHDFQHEEPHVHGPDCKH
ncbi:MAG: trigger factor [Chthoniobacterales bacterium]